MMIIFRFVLTVFAFIVIFFGAITAVTPAPFGIILLLLGFWLLALAAPDFVKRLRKKWRWLDRRLIAAEKHAPGWIARLLKRTRPDDDDDDPDTADTNSVDSEKRRALSAPNPLRRRS